MEKASLITFVIISSSWEGGGLLNLLISLFY